MQFADQASRMRYVGWRVVGVGLVAPATVYLSGIALGSNGIDINPHWLYRFVYIGSLACMAYGIYLLFKWRKKT